MGSTAGLLIYGNQLFAVERLQATLRKAGHDPQGLPVLMVEDPGLCSRRAHHQMRMVMVMAAMRSYRDSLSAAGFKVTYHALTASVLAAHAGSALGTGAQTLEQRVAMWVRELGLDRLLTWEIPGAALERRTKALAQQLGRPLEALPSPMFLSPRPWLDAYFETEPPAMVSFYRAQRKRLDVMMTGDKPRGGKWSFDGDNRKPLPKEIAVPGIPAPAPDAHVAEVSALVARHFPDNPGRCDPKTFWLPTRRDQALATLERFVEERLECFGPYEDALSTRDPFLFHSVLSPALNLGLLAPDEVLDRVLQAARDNPGVPVNSLEGFVRQIIGWREFVFGIYRRYGRQQAASNHFGHRRTLTEHWVRGDTGLPPLDDVIGKLRRWGWAHHIERLMVLGNLMLLCEIEPRQAHGYFMDMFVDASAWVMGPNVYGMALFSDGGIFATKPYVCGSNYILKMSDYRKPRSPRGSAGAGAQWTDTMDGLYWRFVSRHRDFFSSQPRLAYALRTLDRIKEDRKRHIFGAAEDFLARVTR